MTRREWLRLTAAASAIASFPRSARAARRRAFGGTLTAAILDRAPTTLASANPRTLDPLRARTVLEREISAALHATLFVPARGEDGGARAAGPPPMVTRAERSRTDPRRWTLLLRPGQSFADGRPLGAAEAAASLARTLESAAGKPLRLLIAGARKTGDLEMEVETTVPLEDLAPILSVPASAIVSLAGNPDPFFGPVGAGAFIPDGPRGEHSGPPRERSALRASPGDSPRPPDEIALVANPKSPHGRAFLDRLRFTRALEGADATAALRRGAVHVTRGTAATPDEERRSSEAGSTVVLAMSPRLPPALRGQIANSPARRVLCEVFLPLRCEPATTLLPPARFGALAPPRAPETPARKGARPKVSANLSLLVADGSPEIREVAERLVWNLLEAGIAAKIGWRTPEELEEQTSERFDLILHEWSPPFLDPGYALAALASTPGAPAGSGLERLASIGDRDARAVAARKADDALRAGGLIVPIVHPRRVVRVAAPVEGLRMFADGRIDWADVGLFR